MARSRSGTVPQAWLTVLWLATTARPGQAIKGLVTLLRGKRVRAWNQLCLAAAANRRYYRTWIAVVEPSLLPHVRAVDPLLIGAILIGSNDTQERHGTMTRASLARAFGTGFPIFDCEAPWPDSGGPRWLLPIEAGDTVSPALGAVLIDQLRVTNATLVYWDEDQLIAGHRAEPWFKPDWDPLLFGSYGGVIGCCVLRADSGVLTGEKNWPALALRISEDELAQQHIPLVLTHRGKPPAAPTYAVAYAPSVAISVIIPTRDRADLLETCLAGLAQTRFPGNHEIILIDNDSREPRTLRLLQQLAESGRARILPHLAPFNFAAMINMGVAAAQGELVCLLNNDIEMIAADWLERMTAFAVRENVGAVGARLLYPNGTIQHAGIALGIGGAAGHIDKGARPVPTAFDPWHDATRTVSAVTAACLLVGRAKFIDSGGMDEENFRVDFNDVDLCLRLNARGWRTIYCAEATLLHHESVSRGTSRHGAALLRFESELAILRARWGTATIVDPHYSPVFRRQSERCLLAF